MAAAWLTTGSAAAEHLQAFMLSFMAARTPARQRESILALLSCVGQPGMRPGRPLMLPLLLAAVAAAQPQALQRSPAFQGQMLSMLQRGCAALSQGTTATERSEACQGTAGSAHACPLSLTLSVHINLNLIKLLCLLTSKVEGPVLLTCKQASAAWRAGYVRLAQLTVQPSEVSLEAVLSFLGALPRRELLAAGPLRELVAGELIWHAACHASLHISACAA